MRIPLLSASPRLSTRADDFQDGRGVHVGKKKKKKKKSRSFQDGDDRESPLHRILRIEAPVQC